MQQPDLGYKVAELRKQKGLTQEQLAEECEVSARTIQRIENGEVEPRAFTRNNLSNLLDFDFGENNVGNESFWLAILHLSSVFCIVPIPLLIWSWKKTRSFKIDKQGRDVLNFQITMTLCLVAAATLMLVLLVGFPMLITGPDASISNGEFIMMGVLPFIALLPLFTIGIFITYQGVVNTVRAMADKPYHYPLSISFVK